MLNKLLHQTQFYGQRWEYYFLSVNKWTETFYMFFLSCRTLGLSGLRSDLGGQFFSTKCLSRTLLPHMHRRQGYFVYPRCWPRRKATILRSTQMIQLCLWYCNNSITVVMFPYSSRRHAESPIWTALPFYRRTHFKSPLWAIDKQSPFSWIVDRNPQFLQ